MANQEHLRLLKQGSDTWNRWRRQHPNIQPELSKAVLRNANFSDPYLRRTFVHVLQTDQMPMRVVRHMPLPEEEAQDVPDLLNIHWDNFGSTSLGRTIQNNKNNLGGIDLAMANLSGADLSGADLIAANLIRTNLSDSDLSGAILSGAILIGANLSRTNLRGADLSGTNLLGANLDGANLSEANLGGANLSGANLSKADLTGCRIYAISAWNIQLKDTIQAGLTITHLNEPSITVDNLEVAQFIYLILNNTRIRDVIDTITAKVVLILGRFTPERKVILDAIREELSKQNYIPVLFDVVKPASRDITETIATLAHLARFVIADITDAKSIPQELMAIVPHLPSVPVQPLILTSQHEYGMFEHFTRYSWVLPVYRYTDELSLLKFLEVKVIAPAEQKAKELEKQ